MSHVSCPMSHVPCPMSHVPCPMSHVPCPMSHVSCVMSSSACLTPHVAYHKSRQEGIGIKHHTFCSEFLLLQKVVEVPEQEEAAVVAQEELRAVAGEVVGEEGEQSVNRRHQHRTCSDVLFLHAVSMTKTKSSEHTCARGQAHVHACACLRIPLELVRIVFRRLSRDDAIDGQ